VIRRPSNCRISESLDTISVFIQPRPLSPRQKAPPAGSPGRRAEIEKLPASLPKKPSCSRQSAVGGAAAGNHVLPTPNHSQLAHVPYGLTRIHARESRARHPSTRQPARIATPHQEDPPSLDVICPTWPVEQVPANGFDRSRRLDYGTRTLRASDWRVSMTKVIGQYRVKPPCLNWSCAFQTSAKLASVPRCYTRLFRTCDKVPLARSPQPVTLGIGYQP
jgi:hypothetical protein